MLVAFYHSEYTPTKMPSVASYSKTCRSSSSSSRTSGSYQSWDESNRGNVRRTVLEPIGAAAAQYYQALKRDCTGARWSASTSSTQDNTGPTLTYIAEFKREIYRLKTVMPKIWGLHDYSDVNRLESWRTLEIVRALGGEIWLTETGGIVKFGGGFPNNHGSGLSRAAKMPAVHLQSRPLRTADQAPVHI